MELQEFSKFVEASEFNAFKSVLESKGIVKALICPNADNYSRKAIDELTEYLKEYFGAKGLAWMKCEEGALSGGISKFFSDELQKSMMNSLGIQDGDALFMIGDETNFVFDRFIAMHLPLLVR
jgi:aspartyl-tRNA synthetase